MISNVNTSVAKSVYPNNDTKTKREENSATVVSQQGDTSRIEALKASIENGQYKVDLDALAKKITDELM